MNFDIYSPHLNIQTQDAKCNIRKYDYKFLSLTIKYSAGHYSTIIDHRTELENISNILELSFSSFDAFECITDFL